MTNAQQASCDRQLNARDNYTKVGLPVPRLIDIEAIAERLKCSVEDVEARLRARRTP